MNLERVETLCRNYLAQSSNPLVATALLLQYLQRQDGLGEMTQRDLDDFLSRHAEFSVVTPDMQDAAMLQAMRNAGFAQGPHAILKTRVPDTLEIAKALQQQAASMEDLLGQALLEATGKGDTAHAASIREALGRLKALRSKMGE